MNKVRAVALMVGIAAAPVAAQPVDEATARGLMYDLRGRSMQIIGLPGLSETDQKVLQEALSISSRDVQYYASIAMAPDEGMTPTSVVQSANFHSPGDADRAALSACNGRRQGGSPCVVVARTLPAGYQPRSLELSVDATQALRRDYRRARAPKAMAISPATGKYSIASGATAAAAAVADCNRQAASLGAQDCVVAIAD